MDAAAGALDGVVPVVLREVKVSLMVLLPRANSECSFMSSVTAKTGESTRDGPRESSFGGVARPVDADAGVKTGRSWLRCPPELPELLE